MTLLDLIIKDYKRREMDPIMNQTTKKLVCDDDFVNSRAFIQFLWRTNISNFEEKCDKIKSKKTSR